MTPQLFSVWWQTLAPRLADHLWQSTLFALAAALLTLALRSNHPRVRFWLWLSASVKFLLPFSLLVALGSHLAARPPSASANAQFSVVMDEITQPFTGPAGVPLASAQPAVHSFGFSHLFPALAPIWLCGALTVILLWCLRWHRVSSMTRRATTLQEGREVEALRRLEHTLSASSPVPMLLSGECLEPGIFGIIQPVLLWPEGISSRLSDEQLNAVLAHELHHIRLRDNLTAAAHMLVEAAFWFHPLVWWLGARMVEERERACDQAVLELGNPPQAYAESILKVCEFCIESPLPCIAGIAGSDLKKRIANIMTNHISRKLDFTRKLLLTTAALLALATPVFFGLVHPAATQAQSQAEAAANVPAFENVSIKPADPSNTHPMTQIMFSPQGFTANGMTLKDLIKDAYGVQGSQISGPADSLNMKFDIQAKISTSAVEDHPTDPLKTLSQHELTMRAFLADRFKLVVREQAKTLPVYALTIAENGPKLQEAKAGAAGPTMTNSVEHGPAKGMMMLGTGTLAADSIPVSQLAQMLAETLRQPVIDQTGLTGKYAVSLQWTPDAGDLPGLKAPDADNSSPTPAQGTSIFTAVQQQLGLKLVAQQGAVNVIAVEHVEMPAVD